VGLGLYLCAQLAAKLSGTLDLTETPGGGATFTLTLPRNQQRGRERTPELAAAAAID
jgi:two-component system OmpR family sensor kinase